MCVHEVEEAALAATPTALPWRSGTWSPVADRIARGSPLTQCIGVKQDGRNIADDAPLPEREFLPLTRAPLSIHMFLALALSCENFHKLKLNEKSAKEAGEIANSNFGLTTAGSALVTL